jgi:membrane-anchored protein YejM (alkaline phosphatase superfamily)
VRSASWGRFARSVPQLLGAFGPATRAWASVRASLRPAPAEDTVNDAIGRLQLPSTPAPGDVFFFVVESLRGDAVNGETAPALAALAGEGLRFDVAVSGGDVTQYGWFTLFASMPALYWEREAPGATGAATLRVARKRGWRVEVLTANDLRYMRLDETLLGASHALADDVFDVGRAPGGPAARDERVMAELASRAARPHPPTVYVVSLDATHLPYTWGDTFDPPFRPFADPGHYMRLQTEPADREAVVRRYRDAVAFDDSLLATFFRGLRASGAYATATIVVAGDHGEEFWEHGMVSHGSEPCSAQTHVALLVKPADGLRAEGDWSSPKALASGADVWPTLLDAAGVRGDVATLFAGVSLLRSRRGAAMAANQRYWYRPGRFMLDDGRRKAELTLRDPDHPFREQDLDLLAFRDEDDSLTDEGLTASRYVALLRERFGSDLDRFFVVRW